MAMLGFFLFAGGDQEDSDVNVGILGLLLAFVSVFTLYTVFFISVLWVSFILPLLVFSFSPPSLCFFSTFCSSVLLGLYRDRRVDNGRQAEGRPPLRRPLLKLTDDDYCCNVRPSFTVENGHWVKGEEDEQCLQNDVVRPFVLLIHAVLKVL